MKEFEEFKKFEEFRERSRRHMVVTAPWRIAFRCAPSPEAAPSEIASPVRPP
jgi:hypothetical protein